MEKQRTFGLVLPAAGSSRRYGGGDKLLGEIQGRSVLYRAVESFCSFDALAQVVIVTAPERFEDYQSQLGELLSGRSLRLVPGGRERWESVWKGVEALDASLELVAVHDAARPLATRELIAAALEAAGRVGGALPVVAEPATLKRVNAQGLVEATVDRRGLYQAQTPQIFQRKRLLEGYTALAARGELADLTDDAQVFERMGFPVAATAGSSRNLKITGSEDLALARGLF